MNKIIIMGRIGQDLELRRTPSDIAVLSFSVAVNRPKMKDKEQVTDWIDCVAWRHNAEFIARYFGKGRMIAIEGTLQTRSYDDKNGVRRKAVEVLVDRAHFCGDSQNSNSGGSAPSRGGYNDGGFSTGFGAADTSSFEMGSDDDFQIIDNDDDLPF